MTFTRAGGGVGVHDAAMMAPPAIAALLENLLLVLGVSRLSLIGNGLRMDRAPAEGE